MGMELRLFESFSLKSFRFLPYILTIAVFSSASARHDALSYKETARKGFRIDGVMYEAVGHQDDFYKSRALHFVGKGYPKAVNQPTVQVLPIGKQYDRRNQKPTGYPASAMSLRGVNLRDKKRFRTQFFG